MPAIGLQSHIWNNNLKSLGMLALYPLILCAVVWACALAFGYLTSAQYGGGPWLASQARAAEFLYEYWPTILAVVMGWFVISYFFHTSMVRALSHSHPVTREQEPELYNLVENLCIGQGMTMPRLEIIETEARNAFASGVDQRSYAITVTRGLMQHLSKDEMEGVLAHELTHIVNRDVRLLMVCIIFTGMLGFAAQMLWSFGRHSLYVRRRASQKGGGAGLLLLALLVILWIGYFATIFMHFGISRRREYMADAGAVAMTKNPEAMMRALMKIAGMDRIPDAPDDIAMMCTANSKAFFGLFATHPPIEDRIRVLAETTNTPIPAKNPWV